MTAGSSKTLSYWFAAVLLCLGGAVQAADEAKPQAQGGETKEKLYEYIVPPQATGTGDKIEIREFFWYTCPHCFGFNAYFDKWLQNKPADVEVVYTPAMFSNLKGAEYAKAFYAAQAIGVLDKVHGALFEAVHVQKKNLQSEADFAKLFVEQGVDEKAFKDAYNSFEVDKEMRNALILTSKYSVSAVPSIIINGKYRILSSKISGYENVLKVMEELIEMERQAKKAAKPVAAPAGQ